MVASHTHSNAQAATQGLIINEIQLLLAEKRTALSLMRTGIAVFALPLSVFSVLIATSRFYTPGAVLHWLIAVLVINLALVALGAYLVVRALLRIHAIEGSISLLKARVPDIGAFVG
jgi:hypothetical protein